MHWKISYQRPIRSLSHMLKRSTCLTRLEGHCQTVYCSPLQGLLYRYDPWTVSSLRETHGTQMHKADITRLRCIFPYSPQSVLFKFNYIHFVAPLFLLCISVELIFNHILHNFVLSGYMPKTFRTNNTGFWTMSLNTPPSVVTSYHIWISQMALHKTSHACILCRLSDNFGQSQCSFIGLINVFEEFLQVTVSNFY